MQPMSSREATWPDGGPSSLRDLQRSLAAVISSSAPLQPTVLLRLPAGVDPEERLAVYARGYPARLGEALRETFPALCHLVGPRDTNVLFERYLRAAPPRSWDLNDAGRDLPRFLRVTSEPTERALLPFVPDLAELEWRIVEAFHARLLSPFDPASVADLPADGWAQAALRFQPGVALVPSAWPLRELWEARDTPIVDIDIDLNGKPDRVLVFRDGLDVRVESLDEAEASALALALDGGDLGEIAEKALDLGRDPGEVSRWFGGWVARGLVAAVGVGFGRAG